MQAFYKLLLQRLIVCGLQMFNASDPECYVDKVRPWIFGYKNNPDFPNGVVFEGVMDNQPQFLRGETGAQSNIIPVLDALLGIEHANDALFQMLKVGAFLRKPLLNHCSRPIWICNLRVCFDRKGFFCLSRNRIRVCEWVKAVVWRLCKGAGPKKTSSPSYDRACI